MAEMIKCRGLTMTKEQKVTRKKVKTAIERANSDLRAALKDAFKCGELGYQDRLVEVLSVANHHTEKALSYMAFEDLGGKTTARQDIGYQERGKHDERH